VFQPNKIDVARFGLAVSKETPNILDENKVNRFFCSTIFSYRYDAFSYPDDFRKRAIFRDYPYRFNISLRVTGENGIRSVEEIIPSDYGYIRRDVKIKGTSNATIGQVMINAHRYKNAENVSFNQFSISINASELLGGSVRNPRYQINPLSDKMVINIIDLEETRPAWNPGSNLTKVDFYQHAPVTTSLLFWSPPNSNYIYNDGNATPARPPVAVRNSVSLVFGPDFSFPRIPREPCM